MSDVSFFTCVQEFGQEIKAPLVLSASVCVQYETKSRLIS
jgi:hypothetical protein